MSATEKSPRHSPSSRALRALLPGIVPLLETRGIHRTDTYRWARGATTPNAERASVIDEVTKGTVPANGWIPDGLDSDPPPRPEDEPDTDVDPASPDDRVETPAETPAAKGLDGEPASDGGSP